MDLAKISPFWFTDVGHKVVYDSWEQYLLWGNNLENMWRDFRLLTWGCKKQAEDEYSLQLIYVNLQSKPNYFGRMLDDNSAAQNYLERNSVEIKIKQKDAEVVRKWLIDRNPDPWGLKNLTS